MRGQKEPRALGVKARGPQAPGFCDRQSPARELVEFQGAATGRKKPPEGGLLVRDQAIEIAEPARALRNPM